jgi:uncharacterized protein
MVRLFMNEDRAQAPEISARIERPRKGPWLQLGAPTGWEWNRVILTIPDLPEKMSGFRILHLTDLHFKKKWTTAHDELIEKVRSSHLDLILITGDFVDSKRNHLPALPNVKRLLRGLPSRMGTYGIVGNHDGPSFARRIVREPIHLLDQERVFIDTGCGGPALHSGKLELVGLVGLTRKKLKPQFVSTIAKRTPGVPRIVMNHYPDTIRKLSELEMDLYLAGHTHGGQACLPGMYPILRHDKLPRKYCSGLHQWRGKWMLVNRGFGFSSFDFRVFCPAEVVEIVLSGR